MTNFVVEMRRQNLPTIQNPEHAGLLLDKGFKTWAKKAGRDATGQVVEQHNNAAQTLHGKASSISYSPIYKKAYEYWRQTQIEILENSSVWFGKLENRMYLGMGVSSPLEAGITLHHTYGVPFIPGSAIKGVLHHYAHDIGVDEDIKSIIFGEDASTDNKQDSGAAGYLIFNDAWWIPEGKALAPEMITVHAEKYYSNKGKDFIHPDFESPNPNPQIAIQGSFLFSIEGDAKWVEYAIKLLEKALIESGIGGKTASGYGYLTKHIREWQSFDFDQNEYRKKLEETQAKEDEKELTEIELSIKKIIEQSNNSAVTLLQKLEQGEWDSSKDKIEVATKIKEIMEEEKKWIPNFSGKNKAKLKLKDRALKVMTYLEEDN